MSQTHLIPDNNLVVYQIVDRSYFGLFLGETETDGRKLFLIYRFDNEETAWTKVDLMLAMHIENYKTMCEPNLWKGLVVRTATGRQATVLAGKVTGNICELYLNSNEESAAYAWVPLSELVPIGHVNVKIPQIKKRKK